MTTTRIDVQELPDRLAEILVLVRGGSEVIVTEGEIARAKLVSLSLDQARLPGLHAGAIQCADDFDAPLPDAYWTGER